MIDTKTDDQIQKILKRLREEREKNRISQMELSFRANLSQNQVNSIESGRRIPNLQTILKLCNALSINPAVLFQSSEIEREAKKTTIMNLVQEL